MRLFDSELGEKLAAAAAEHCSGMVTSMHAIVEYMDEDGEQRVVVCAAPGQKATTSAGLLALASSISDFELRAYVGEMYDTND